MKLKIALMMIALVFVCSSAVIAEEGDAWWGSWYSRGNVALSVRAALESHARYGGGLGVYPGVEMIVLKPSFGEIAPLDIGVAARGHLGIAFDSRLDNNFTAGVGVLGTAHLGFRGLDFLRPDIVERLDYFVELGLAFDLIKYDADRFPLSFCAFTGINYYLNPALAVTVGYNQWGGVSGAFLGAQVRLGPSPGIKALEVRAPSGRVVGPQQLMMAQMYVAQFYAIYWYAFAAGGFYFDDSTYEVGDGTVWELTGSDSHQGLLLEKALLREETDGSRWWRVSFTTNGDRLVYEYLIGPDYRLIEMVYRDVSEDLTGEYVFTGKEAGPYAVGTVKPITAEDYARYHVRSERVRVRAGTFNSDLLQHVVVGQDDTWTYSWWVADGVPGGLVKFLWELEKSDDWMQGELVEITRGNRPELIE